MKASPTQRKISSQVAPSVVLETRDLPGAEERLKAIAMAAYYKAEARGFVPGLELDDWLEAEAEFDERMEH